MPKKLPLNARMLAAMRVALHRGHPLIMAGRDTEKALVRRGFAYERRRDSFYLTAQGIARARFAADVVSKSETQPLDPDLMKDL